MKKCLLIYLLFLCHSLSAQNDACNKLGAWLWYIEITEFETHEALADTLAALGVKRVFVKVADGAPNPAIWPELLNSAVPQAYQSRGLECWAWSYNYNSDPIAQADALYLAAQTGYEGFIVDVEVEFDGLTTPLSNLFAAFESEKEQAIEDGIADDDFKLYCTTWGNPLDHDFHIELIDPHVDGFMPQTYVEQWGSTFVENLEYWIEVGNQEYIDLGATKPIHHIVATENNVLTSEHLNRFIETSGGESSIWRIPGGGTSLDIWEDWNEVEWDKDFCQPNATRNLTSIEKFDVSPNPATEEIFLPAVSSNGTFEILNALGRVVLNGKTNANSKESIQLSTLNPGIFTIKWTQKDKIFSSKFIKN